MLPTTPLPTALPLGPAGTLTRAATWNGAGALLSRAKPRSCKARSSTSSADRRAQLVAERNAAALDRDLGDGQLPRRRGAGLGRRRRRGPRRGGRRLRPGRAVALERPASRRVALDPRPRCAQRDTADRRAARDRVDMRIVELDRLGGDLRRLGLAERELRQQQTLGIDRDPLGASPPACQSIATSALSSPASGGTRTLRSDTDAAAPAADRPG